MAIKYYSIPEKRQVIGVLSGCKWDCVNKIDKMMKNSEFMLAVVNDKYIMPDTFKVVVTCDPRDEYNVEEGKRIAKKKVLRNYHKSMDKRMAKFNKAVANMVGVVNVKPV